MLFSEKCVKRKMYIETAAIHILDSEPGGAEVGKRNPYTNKLATLDSSPTCGGALLIVSVAVPARRGSEARRGCGNSHEPTTHLASSLQRGATISCSCQTQSCAVLGATTDHSE